MADFTTGSITEGAGVAGSAQLAGNYLKHVINQADVGRELIVKVSADAGILDAELSAAIKYITTSHGSAGTGDSAFTVAAVGTATGAAFVAGTTQTVFLRVQGTGDLTVASVKSAAEGANANGTTFTVSIEAIFTPAK